MSLKKKGTREQFYRTTWSQFKKTLVKLTSLSRKSQFSP